MTLGHLPKDQHQGALAALWASKLEAAAGCGVTAADVSGGFADLFGVKDDGEVLNVKKAAFLSTKVRMMCSCDQKPACCLQGLLPQASSGAYVAAAVSCVAPSCA